MYSVKVISQGSHTNSILSHGLPKEELRPGWAMHYTEKSLAGRVGSQVFESAIMFKFVTSQRYSWRAANHLTCKPSVPTAFLTF